MEPKKNRSIGLIIRRFFAIFILFSTASGIVAQIETGTVTNETFGSAFVSLLIAYYLARSPRNKTQSSDGGLESNNDEIDDDCLLYTSPSPRDKRQSRMPSSA